MDIKETLLTLSSAVGVSGEEKNASTLALGMLKNYTDNAYCDDFGNVIGYIDNDAKKTILLDAHIDEIGLIVSYIDDKGFIKVGNCGGVDRRLLLAQTVTIYGTKAIKGVISTLPPHVGNDMTKTAKLDDIAIDTGFTKEQLSEIVSLGDKITLNSTPTELKNGLVTGKAIDDRSGVTAILYTLELIKGKKCGANVAVVFSAQEETGERGAKIASFKVEADEAIAIDVSFGKTPDSSPEKTWELGKGTMIGYAASLSRAVSDKLVKIAKEKEIPYQIEVMCSETGTNADAIAVSRGGVKAVTLSIPLRYMHTPIEVVNPIDIENTAKIAAEYIIGGGLDA